MALAILGVLAPWSALAQGGQGQQVEETIGPYRVRVVTVPSNLSLGRVQFIVVLLDVATQQPIPDARVVVRTHREGESTGGWALALYIPEAIQHYQAAVHLQGPGIWRAQVEISGPRGDALLVEVPPIHVPEMRRFTSGSLVFIGVFAVIALGAGYVLWSAARQGRRRAAAARQGQGPPGPGP